MVWHIFLKQYLTLQPSQMWLSATRVLHWTDNCKPEYGTIAIKILCSNNIKNIILHLFTTSFVTEDSSHLIPVTIYGVHPYYACPGIRTFSQSTFRDNVYHSVYFVYHTINCTNIDKFVKFQIGSKKNNCNAFANKQISSLKSKKHDTYT